MRLAGLRCAGQVDVLVSVPGEPPGLALRVGGYCVGHAVIVGVQVQLRYGKALWYAPLLDHSCDGRAGRN